MQKRRNRHAIRNDVVWYQPNNPKCHYDIREPMCFPPARELVYTGFLAWKIRLWLMNIGYSTGAAAGLLFVLENAKKAHKAAVILAESLS